jgi:hypothetical protein
MPFNGFFGSHLKTLVTFLGRLWMRLHQTLSLADTVWPGANPTTFEFTATTPALYALKANAFFKEEIFFVFRAH